VSCGTPNENLTTPQLDQPHNKGSTHPFRNVLSTIIYSYKMEGIGIFFRGLAPTIIRCVLSWTIKLQEQGFRAVSCFWKDPPSLSVVVAFELTPDYPTSGQCYSGQHGHIRNVRGCCTRVLMTDSDHPSRDIGSPPNRAHPDLHEAR
jgi:hypothetical protein